MASITKAFAVTSDGNTYYMLSSSVVRVKPNTSGSAVTYILKKAPNAGLKYEYDTLTVSETAAAVALAAGGSLIGVTVGGATEYINPLLIQRFEATGSNSNIWMNAGESVPNPLLSSTTAANVAVAINNNLGGGVETLTGAGAVSLSTFETLLVTTGANALTLAAGYEGQRKFIKMKTDGGDGTLTPNSLQGGTTITFNDAGDFVELLYVDGTWNIIVNSGCTVA